MNFITEVQVKKITNEEQPKLKAVATMILNDCFAVKDIRIIEGANGLFVAMPSRKAQDGYRDIAHPINPDSREYIQTTILEAYNKAE